eukprot:PhF_6_TR41328/c0_g1_i1/m.62651
MTTSATTSSPLQNHKNTNLPFGSASTKTPPGPVGTSSTFGCNSCWQMYWPKQRRPHRTHPHHSVWQRVCGLHTRLWSIAWLTSECLWRSCRRCTSVGLEQPIDLR